MIGKKRLYKHIRSKNNKNQSGLIFEGGQQLTEDMSNDISFYTEKS